MAIRISGSGIDMGNTPLSNASQVELQEEQVTPFSGFKNYIINGNFDIWQRGTSSVLNSSKPSGITADRWLASQQFATGELTVSKSSLVYNGVTYDSQKVLTTKPVVISGYSHCIPFYYKIEGNNAYSLNGKNFTMSFIFKTNVAGTYPISFTTSSDGAVGNNTYVTTFNAISGTQKITINVPSCNTIGKTNGYGLRIVIASFASSGAHTTSTLDNWIPNSGNLTNLDGSLNWATSTNNYVEIAQVQLEEGSVATPFEQRPYGLELSLCQRYCKDIGNDRAYGHIGNGFCHSNTSALIEVDITGMRTIPVVENVLTANRFELEGQGRYTASAISINASDTANKNKLNLYVTSSGLTAGWAVGFRNNNNTTNKIILSSEL